jgi:hypothetical protein
MNARVVVDRRRALWAVAALAIASMPFPRAIAAAKASAEKDPVAKSTPPPVEGDSGKDAPATPNDKGAKGIGNKGKIATLTVAVVGNDQPVAQAEVKVKFPPDAGNEVTLSTNTLGEAVFTSSATGTAKVRVIAPGWKSTLQDVALKEGAQRVTIKLAALPN